jgi:parallel beta-helix repeat protein
MAIRKSIIFLIVFTLFISLNFVIYPVEICNAETKTLHVGHGHPYTTIQDAINDANESDIIYVHRGTYTENIVVDKSVTLIGENKLNTIISSAGIGHIIKINKNNVNLSGFTIQNSQGSGYDCLMLNKVDNCFIYDNIIQNSADEGVFLFDSEYNKISENIIKNNENYGVSTSYSDNNNIDSNQIIYNENGMNIGSFSDSNEIYDNYVIGKQDVYWGYGIKLGTQTSDNIIYKNKINDFDLNANDLGSGNFWYKDTTQEGNYWDDYTGEDSGDGRGTIPYNIQGSAGSKDMYPLGYFINPEPEAYIDSISPNPALEGDTITFTGHGTDDGYIISYEWRIGSLKKQGPNFQYSGLCAGTYTVKFRVQDDDGDWSDYYEKDLIVNPSPTSEENQIPTAVISSIIPSIAIEGQPIYFEGYGVDNDGIITQYFWSSDIDGFLSNKESFNSTNLSIGTHNIAFKVLDNKSTWSNIDNWIIEITADPAKDNNPPVANIDANSSGFVNNILIFNGSKSYDPDINDTITYSWDMGDGTIKTGEIVEHVYTEVGNYTITLTVTDSFGFEDQGSVNVKILAETTNEGKSNGETPGFDVIVVIIGALFLILIKKKRK